MLVTCASVKGGTGKTTTCIHLGAAWARRRRVLLVDADSQQAAYTWGETIAGFEVASVPPRRVDAYLEQQVPLYDVVLVDTAPDSPGRSARPSTSPTCW